MKNITTFNFKTIPLFKTIKFKIIITFVIFSIAIFVAMNLLVSFIITHLVESLISEKLNSDIKYIEDIISDHTEAYWNIKDNALYFGDILIGDGTEQTANFEPFYEHEEKTGSLSYVFMIDKSAKLGYIQGYDNLAGYEQGPYLRIAGTTKDPNGDSIVGTYIEKSVSDSLEKYGYYAGEAIVSGGYIYCLYNTLLDRDNNVVGAVVVGRYTSELKAQIQEHMRWLFVVMFLFTLICSLFILILMSRWLSAIKEMVIYLRQIEDGYMPSEQLTIKNQDEMSIIADSINTMVMSFKENVMLRKKSETDALTNLPNRFAYELYLKNIHKNIDKSRKQTLAVEILDIDYFKKYNDNYGHQEGDNCIKQVAEEIRKLMMNNKNVFACRYGGDEFVLIYKDYEKEQVGKFASKLKESLNSRKIKHEYSQISNVVTISQGICFDVFSKGSKVEEFLQRADDALYYVKKNNRNDYKIFSL